MNSIRMQAFEAELEKIAKNERASTYRQDFVAGMEPFGAVTGRYGQNAQRAKLSEKEHKRKKAISAAGGLVGGGLAVPSVILGLSGAGKGLIAGRGVKGKIREAVRGGVSGAKKPVKVLYHGTKTGRLIRKASKSKDGVRLSRGDARSLKYVVKQIPLGTIRRTAKNHGNKVKKDKRPPDVIQTAKTLNRLRKARKGDIKIGQGEAKAAMPAIKKQLAQGYSQIALGGAVGAGGAAVQYQKGRKAEQEFERRSKEKKAAAGRADDPDVPPTEKNTEPEDMDKRNCIECGAVLSKDDLHCRRCGARQVVPNKLPKAKVDKVKRKEEEERLKDKDLEEGTGGEAAAEAVQANIEKSAFLVGAPKGISKKFVSMFPEKHHKKAVRGLGVAVLGTGVVGAKKINQALYGKKEDQTQPGMVRTAAVKCRRRSINPAYNIKAGKKKRTIREALAKHRE